jgi:hypothetical protein
MTEMGRYCTYYYSCLRILLFKREGGLGSYLVFDAILGIRLIVVIVIRERKGA